MPETEQPAVQVIRWSPSEGPDLDGERPDEMGPASARHARATTGRWQRTRTAGQEALTSSAESIAAQVDLVAERMMAALEQRRQDRAATRVTAGQPEPPWDLSEVEVSFGVQLTGEATVAVFSVSSESSAQITLTFTRAQDSQP